MDRSLGVDHGPYLDVLVEPLVEEVDENIIVNGRADGGDEDVINVEGPTEELSHDAVGPDADVAPHDDMDPIYEEAAPYYDECVTDLGHITLPTTDYFGDISSNESEDESYKEDDDDGPFDELDDLLAEDHFSDEDEDLSDEDLDEVQAIPCDSGADQRGTIQQGRNHKNKRAVDVGETSKRGRKPRKPKKRRTDDEELPVQPIYPASDSSSKDSYGLHEDNPGQLRPVGSDDEDFDGQVQTELWYDPNWKIPYFQCGMRFQDHHQFKEAAAKYSILKCYALRCSKSEPGRQKYVCKDGCKWDVFASFDVDKTFRVKTYSQKHSCSKEFSSDLATAEWLAKYFRKRIRANPFFKLKDLIKAAKIELNLDIKECYYKIMRAKRRVVKGMEGSYKDEYAVVQGYANYLKSVNPRNTIKVKTTRRTAAPGQPLCFEGMYFCFDAVKEGWKKGCRPIIGLDGTHLKGICQGVLLVAVGRDGNDNVYPIAWAVVDTESYETWYNFIKQVREDLDLKDGEGITIVSDRNAGLLKARAVLLPEAEHRHCSRHLYANWGKRHKGKNLKGYFWRCVSASFREGLEREMRNLRSKNEAGYQELMSLDGHNWTVSMFKETAKCDVPHNNISETFNNTIVEARALPIISMSEWIYNYIFELRGIQLSKAAKWKTNIAPRARKKIRLNSNLAGDCRVVSNHQGSFRVEDDANGWGHTVNMVTERCSCKYWELNGIPCSHVIACCKKMGVKPETLVCDWYRKEKFIKTYETPLECTRGPEMWVNYTGEKVEAPVMKCKPGRPRVNRFKCTNEVQKVGKNKEKLSRKGRVMHCRNCKSTTHNVRTCARHRTAGEPRAENQ